MDRWYGGLDLGFPIVPARRLSLSAPATFLVLGNSF
jgi:hypothetical protein